MNKRTDRFRPVLDEKIICLD